MGRAANLSGAPPSCGARARSTRSKVKTSRTCSSGRETAVPSKTILAIWAVALSVNALAQYRQPTEQEVERAKQQYRQPTDAEVDVARRKYRQPPEAQLNRAASSQSPVNLDAIPMPTGSIDVEGLARAYEQNRQAFEKDKGYASDQPVLFVFVTLGMPAQTLRLLNDEAWRT